MSKGLSKQGERDRRNAAGVMFRGGRSCGVSDIPDNVGRASLAFEFLILTASRTTEVLASEWPEFDIEQKVWIVPAKRMKAKRPHRVPLTERCLEILDRAKQLGGGSSLVFPGRSAQRPLSNMVLATQLRRLGLNVTAHGFRSSFRDWAAECTSYPREVAEMALAHTIENKVEAAYRRGDLFDKRRELMNDWESFIQAGH